MSIPEVNAFYIGALIALYKRAVGCTINPALKRARKRRANCWSSRKQVRTQLSDKGKTAEQIARADPEDVFHSLRHLASNDLRINVTTGDEPADDRFSLGP
jgi:hypothetical protein